MMTMGCRLKTKKRWKYPYLESGSFMIIVVIDILIVGARSLNLEDLAIDIAYYISQIELQMAATIKRSESRLKEKGRVLEEDRLNILLRGAMMIAKRLEEEIYHEVKEREHKSYNYCSNEINILALATLLSAWSSWVFKSKSDDKN